MILFAILAACNDNTLAVDGAEGVGSDTTDGGDELDATWDNARLVIEAPLSGAFLPMEEDSAFTAVVTGSDGTVLDFPGITWTSDIDADWALSGAAAIDGQLGIGIHAITAEARLPNGDRLAYTVGGVLKQSVYAGVYVGALSVTADAEYNGTPISVGCSGALTMIVEAEGKVVTGAAGCLLSLLGYDIDTAYDFALDNDAGDLSGEAAIDLSVYSLPVATEGTLSEAGELEGSFGADVAGFLTLDANYRATLITRDLSTVQ
ncbi:MAG: hypothetical protein EXR71_04155 [Myxococcales bacterium]|nr:hypothetical protein [Myxococcales bacterium]